MDIIELLGSHKEKFSVAIGIVAEQNAYGPFDEAFQNINAAYEKYNLEKSDHSREELLELMEELFESTKFGNIQSSLLKFSERTADIIISNYIEAIDKIFDCQSFADLKPNYQLNADQKATQRSKICFIITTNFSSASSDIREIETLRAWLQSNYSAYVSATSEEFDLGAVARNFGAGALAVASPWVGIPAFIVNWKMQSDKQKNSESQVEYWINQFSAFEDKIIALRQQLVDSAEKTKSYAIDKSKEVNGDAIITVCKNLEKLGHKLSYFENFITGEISELDTFILDNTQGD